MNAANRFSTCVGCLFAFLICCSGFSPGSEPGSEEGKARLREGRDLFLHRWVTRDSRSFAGDGLGPVFNARSCIECHYQGGYGGSGPGESNTTTVSAFVDLRFPGSRSRKPGVTPFSELPVRQPDRTHLARIHPALEFENSFPLHQFSEDENYQTWKSTVRIGTQIIVGDVKVSLQASTRNTPALLGAGLIDRIPVSVLEAVAAEQARASSHEPIVGTNPPVDGARVFPPPRQKLPVTGRVARLKDGRVGRFGWKNSVATLRDFTLQACSIELGLEVPGFPRPAPPWIKGYKAPGLDLSAAQCDCLTEYVAALPRPKTRAPETPGQTADFAAGQEVFRSIGCAQCHRPKLGDVDGIYSDLLLHDMGSSLMGAGHYGPILDFEPAKGPAELPVVRDIDIKAGRDTPPQFGAGGREWRTPPLWGLRDSAPYLHDGRTSTIEGAILAHDGEGTAAAKAFEKLKPHQRRQLDLFLDSLVAPPMPW